ncbi:hypothetical protein DICA3_D19812 [Diutina catenulata]
MTDKPERKLRGHTKPRRTERMFSFESINPYIYRNKAIAVRDGNAPPSAVAQQPAPVAPPLARPTTVKKYALPCAKYGYDPLCDESYHGFHRRMATNEKIRRNEDRARMSNECDGVRTQLQLLTQDDWIRHVQDIVVINNFGDYGEVETKRGLAVAECNTLIAKYEHWKRRADHVAHEVKQGDGWPGHPEPDGDYGQPLAVVKRLRAKQFRRRYGPVVRLRLDQRYTLVMDPMAPPKIVDCRGTKVAPVAGRVANGNRPSCTQPKVDIITDVTSNWIFGVDTTKLRPPRQGFVLPASVTHDAGGPDAVSGTRSP